MKLSIPRRWVLGIALCLAGLILPGALTRGAPAAGGSQPLRFPQCGFTIAPLEQTSDDSYLVLNMFLPATDKFAPNINVQLQPYSGTMDQYITLSRQQMKLAQQAAVKDQKLDANSWVIEMTGTVQNRPMHWYVKAVKKSATVYLTTATALTSQWEAASPQLIACVDSFQADGGK